MAADQTSTTVADAIGSAFISPNESDSNGEPANVVDGLFAIARALERIALAMEDARSSSPPDSGQYPAF